LKFFEIMSARETLINMLVFPASKGVKQFCRFDRKGNDMGQESHKELPASAAIEGSKNLIARKVMIGPPVGIALCFLLFATSYWGHGQLVDRSITGAGIVLMGICIIGRTWSSLYIGGRKNLEIIDTGPYSLTRNPLYFFSIIGAVGAAAQFGSVSLALLAGVFTWIVFFWVTTGEEIYLLKLHGDIYRHYMARVPRFMPKLESFNSPETLVIRPRAVVSTFFDGLFFLSSIPLAELFKYLHSAGLLPVFFRLP
jgi:protein-S-isoprenylcysteine O-methyltransferase Ste14